MLKTEECSCLPLLLKMFVVVVVVVGRFCTRVTCSLNWSTGPRRESMTPRSYTRCDWSLGFIRVHEVISKGVNKAALLYVEPTVTVHIVLFYV